MLVLLTFLIILTNFVKIIAMKFIIRNQANIPNKYVRFSKWKIRKLSKKFAKLIYSEIYIQKVGHNPEVFKAVIKLGLPGPDLIISAKSENLKQLWATLSLKMKRQLRKYNNLAYKRARI